MSAVVGVQTTKFAAGSGGSNWVPPGFIKTEAKKWYDYYEASALADASTIKIATLPKGAKIVGVTLAFDALGSATLAMGDSTTADRYITATSVASAGRTQAINIDGLGYVIGTATDDEHILLTVASAAITGTIKVVIDYTEGDNA